MELRQVDEKFNHNPIDLPFSYRSDTTDWKALYYLPYTLTYAVVIQNDWQEKPLKEHRERMGTKIVMSRPGTEQAAPVLILQGREEREN